MFALILKTALSIKISISQISHLNDILAFNRILEDYWLGEIEFVCSVVHTDSKLSYFTRKGIVVFKQFIKVSRPRIISENKIKL